MRIIVIAITLITLIAVVVVAIFNGTDLFEPGLKPTPTPTLNPMATTSPPLAWNSEWVVDSGEEFTEHAVIYNGSLYIPTCDYTHSNGGVKKYSMSGVLDSSYASTVYTLCTPVVADSASDGNCIFLYDKVNKYVSRIRESTNTITHSFSLGDWKGATTSSPDIESMGWDTANERLIVPYDSVGGSGVTSHFKALSMDDLSGVWTFTMSMDPNGRNLAAPLIVGSYVYVKSNANNYLYKLNLSDGTVADSVDLGGYSWASYASPMYDPDNSYIYCIGAKNVVKCVDPSDMSVVWTHTFAAGSSSNTDHVTYTDMGDPFIHNAMGYHNGKVFVPVREDQAGGDQYYAKMYGIGVSDGHLDWTNTASAWTDGLDYNTMLLTDDYVVVTALDYNSGPTYDRGRFYIIDQSDGTEQNVGALAWGPMCGGATQAYDGRVIFCEENGYAESIKLGWGSTLDSVHYMKNSYHNGYCGDRLTINTSLTFTERSDTITNGIGD